MKRIYLVLAVALSALLLSHANLTFAASYDVNASVPYPAPTQVAVIDNALDGVTVENAAFMMSGTCEIMSPVTVVSIVRGTNVLGSVACVSGAFSLQITLAEGVNSLIARTTNQSNITGPDSTPITVTLNIPPPPPQPSVDPKPVTTPGSTTLPPAEDVAINEGVKTDLSMVAQTPFSVLAEDNQVSLTFVIDGGSTPYTIELNWGDGSVETRVIDKPGTYTFTHQYRTAGNYTVKGKLTDVLGVVHETTYAVVSPDVVEKMPITPGHTTTPDSSNSFVSWISEHWLPVTVGTATLAIVGAAFWLGKTTAEGASLASGASANTTSNNTKTTRKAPKPKAKPKPRGKR